MWFPEIEVPLCLPLRHPVSTNFPPLWSFSLHQILQHLPLQGVPNAFVLLFAVVPSSNPYVTTRHSAFLIQDKATGTL